MNPERDPSSHIPCLEGWPEIPLEDRFSHSQRPESLVYPFNSHCCRYVAVTFDNAVGRAGIGPFLMYI